MLNAGKNFRALRDKKNKYSNSCVVQIFFSERSKKQLTPPLQVKWSVKFFPAFNIRLYDKNSESDYFFQQHWESEYFFRKKP
jgi:hypothetical protein